MKSTYVKLRKERLQTFKNFSHTHNQERSQKINYFNVIEFFPCLPTLCQRDKIAKSFYIISFLLGKRKTCECNEILLCIVVVKIFPIAVDMKA
jgi:hypothetical protein